MPEDFSDMQGQETGETQETLPVDMKQGERNRLNSIMADLQRPDAGARMHAGEEAVDAGLRQVRAEGQSRYDMAVQHVRATQGLSEHLTPGSIEESKAVAKYLGIPYQAAIIDPVEAKKEYVIRRITEQEYAAQWAGSSEENASYARTYLDTVVDFFKDMPNWKEWGDSLMHWLVFDSGKAIERFGYNMTEGAAQANKAFVDFGRMFAENIGMEPTAKYLEGVSKGLDRYRNLAEQFGVSRPKEEKVGALWDEFVKSVPQQVWNLASLALFKRPLPGTLAVGAGEVAGARAAAAVNPLLAKAGEGLAGTGIMGAQIAGGSYGELREQGVSPEIAGIAAAGNALMQAPMERFGMERFVDIFRAKGMREAMLKAVTSIFSEGATEWAQKWPEYLAHTWALSEKHGNNVFDRANWFLSNLFDWKKIQQANDEAMLEAAVGAMWGGLGGGVRIAMTRSMQRQAREQADLLLGIRQFTQMAIDKGMPPEVVKTMLEAKQPLMASTGYVDAEAALTLYQDGNAAVLEALGVTEEELTQLADEGGAVPIQLSDLETRVDQATFDKLYQHVSIRPGSLTAAEGAQSMDADAYTRSALAQARRRANQIPGVSAELSRMYHELLDAGIPRQQARDNTTLLAVQAATLQAKGFDALSWLKRRKYVVGEDGKAYTVPVGIPQTEGAELVSEDVRNQIAASTDKDALSKMFFDNQQAAEFAVDEQEANRLQAVNRMVEARLVMLNSVGVTLHQFYGEQGVARLDEAEKTTRLADLDVARQMETAGKDSQAVKLATGWERGADGKWRYEQLDPQFVDNFEEILDNRKPRPLWKVLKGGKSNPLFKAYPDLLKYKIQTFGSRQNYAGYLDDDARLVKVSDRLVSINDTPEMKRLFLKDRNMSFEAVFYHELQHAIQHQEGFARGGEPSEFENFYDEERKLREIYDAWAKDAGLLEFTERSMREFLDKKKTLKQHFDDIEKFEKNSPYYEHLKAAREQINEYIDWHFKKYGTARTPEEIYRRLAGEVEARNASKRMDMSPEDRRASLASATEDVARKDQILLGVAKDDAQPALYQSQVDDETARLDAEYMAAVESGDMDKASAMVEARAREMGFENAIPEQSASYHVRTKPAPKKTRKAYKVFYVNPQTGAPTALFVGGAESLPVGVWLDANDQWHFKADNGKEYVPSTKNPNRTDLSGKKKNSTTGASVPIPDDPAVRQYLLEHGFITEKAKSVTALAYRPGWHAGTLPFFPQGGKKQAGSNYGNVHEHNQIVFEIEIAADKDWTDFARSQKKAQTKAGTVNNRNADLQQLPTGGFYTYTTNPILDPKEGAWVISDSIKIVRALSQEECDKILQESGKAPQEWEQGQLNLEEYSLDDEEHSDAARKTLAPVTYDENGSVIPLSKRFDASNPSVLYEGGASSPRGSYTRTVQGEDLIRIFQGHDASTVQHESAHAYHQLLEDMAADDGTAARQACMDALVKSGMLEGVAEQYAGLPVEELGQVIADLQAQAVQLDESMNTEGADKEGIKQERQGILAQIDALTQLQRHQVAVEQARQDLRTIREWAGVPVEGALTREQYIKTQEQFARGYEGYLATGKAPTVALAGVFARFKQWLLAVYKNIRDYVGADITPEIKDVYDRMLATEEEMQADEVAQAMLGEMPDAIAMLGCNASDAAYLEDLLTRAHMAASSRVDKERNKDRKKRFKAAKEQALTDLLDTPLWRLATGGYGIINYESLKEFLGDKDANELRKKLPKVIKSGEGSTIDVIAMGFEGDAQMSAQFDGNADDLAQLLYEHIVLNGETLNGEATALANQALESQDAEYSVEDGFLAGDEYGEFLDALEDEAAKMQRRASARGKKKAEAREAAAEQKAEEAQAEAEAKAKAKAEQESRLAGVRAERKALWHEYERRAKEELDATPVGQIDPKRYAKMLRKALKGKDNAILSRDPDKAVEAVRKARYAYALMREAKRRRDMIERNLTMIEKLCRRKPGDIAPIPATALARLLQKYGFRVPKRWGGDPAHESDTMQAMASACIAEAQGEDTVEVTPDLAEWVMQEAVPDYAQDASWQSLTWADYNDLMDVFNFFVHASKEQNQNSKDSMKARVEFLVEQAVQSMQGMQTQTSAAKGTWRRAWQNTWRRIFGAIQALQWQFRKADGFKNAGPKGEAGALESLVMRPILEGENEFRARMKELSALLAPHLEALRQTGLRLQAELGNKNGELIKLGVKLPEALALSEGRSSWTTDQVVALALNCGNTGNRQRITGGYPDLNYKTLAAIVGSDLAAQICQDNDIAVPENATYQSGIFTADDWAAVQGVWDAIETLWEPTVKVHRSMYGFAPRRVDVEPMAFRAQGVEVALNGGYYPIYYDKDISLEAQQWGERDDIISTTESFFPAPSAKRGHTKSRQKKTKHPLRLATSTLMDHMQDALKLICFGEAVRFADRVTKHPVFAAEYTRVFGQEDYKAIRPNLKGVVRSEPAPKDAMIRLANATRKYLVSAGLWGNMKVAILQTTALGPAMGDLGAVPVWQAMGRIATGGWGLIREIQQASPYMMSRWRAFDQDLLDKAQSLDINNRPKTVKIGTKEYSWDDVVNMGMTPLCLVDLVTSGAIWQAAYSKYMKDKGLPGSLDQGGQYHAEAVQFADEEVKKSNPDFDASSRSAFLRAQNSYRLFNAFGSAVTLMAQRGEYMLQAMKHGRITKAQFARWEAYEMLAPAVAMTLIMALARGIVGGGDDDGEKLFELFLESLLDQYSMKVPFFGSIIESTIESAAGISNSGRQPTMRTVVDTPINLFYRVPTAAVKAWDGDDEAKKKLAYAVGDLASFFVRVPASKLIRNAERGYDQWQRGEGTPASMVMPAPGK